MHVADLMPTLLELGGATYPSMQDGQPLPRLIGKSWKGVLANEAASPRTERDYIAWEVFGNRALRQGDWKIRWEFKPLGKAGWELFKLDTDPAERKDLAAENPEKVKAMMVLWDEYVRENNVILPSRSMFESLDDQMPPRVADDTGYPPLIYEQQFVPPPDMLSDPKPRRRSQRCKARVHKKQKRWLDESRKRPQDPAALDAADSSGDTRVGRAAALRGDGTGARTLLLEVAVRGQCGAAGNQFAKRQFKSIRSCAPRDRKLELRRDARADRMGPYLHAG
jgi:hypothetical protein